MQTLAPIAELSSDSIALIEAQRDLETRASQDGYNRYIKQQDATVSNLGGHTGAEAVKMIRGAIPLVSEKIVEWLKANDRTGPGKRHLALAVLKRLDPDMMAFLALNSVFSGITQESTIVATQSLIGGQIEAEIMNLDIVETQGRKVAVRIQDVVSRNNSTRHRQRIFNKLAKEQLPDREAWAQDYKVRVAEPLLNAVLQGVPDLFELVTLSKGVNNRAIVVRLTDAGVHMMGDLRESMGWMAPIHRPMVVPPRPWTGMDTGCYYEDRTARTVKLVRTYNRDHKKLIREAIANGQMD